MVLVSPSNDEYEQLVERLRERMNETCMETIYEIGTGGAFLKISQRT